VSGRARGRALTESTAYYITAFAFLNGSVAPAGRRAAIVCFAPRQRAEIAELPLCEASHAAAARGDLSRQGAGPRSGGPGFASGTRVMRLAALIFFMIIIFAFARAAGFLSPIV
jgi:hypothetical protein